MSEETVRKTIKLNTQLWEEFQDKIEQEYGTTYKHTSEEIEKAIANYINKDIQDIEKTKTTIQELKTENKNLKDENKKLSKEVKENTDSQLKLTNENKQHTDEITNQKETIQQLETENYNFKKEITKLEQEIDKNNKTINSQEKQILELKESNKVLEDKYIEQVETTNKQVQENTKIKNKREHAQERLNKTQDELNETLKRLEKYSYAIGQVQHMNIIDRLLNRLPEQIKELQPASDKNIEDKEE